MSGITRLTTLLLLGALTLAGSGCTAAADTDADAGLAELREGLQELRGRLAIERLRAEVQELRAREAIRELYADYGRTLDERDFAAFARLFTTDAELVGGNGTATGPEAIAASLEGSLSRAAGPDLHIFTNEKIDVTGDTATAISRGAWVVQADDGRPRAAIWATYRDELAVEDGVWKFRRREIAGDIPGRAR